MNKYGHMAMRHWKQTDPGRYQQLGHPEEFFQALGDQVETRIQQLAAALAGPDPTGETYLEKVGRLNMARSQAEEQALTELVWIPASPELEEDLASDYGLTEQRNELQRILQEPDDHDENAGP